MQVLKEINYKDFDNRNLEPFIDIVRKCDGHWVADNHNKDILLNFFIGENLLTDKQEVYINIFLNKKIISNTLIVLTEMIKHVMDLIPINIEYIYWEFFPKETVDFSLIEAFSKNNLPNSQLISISVTKDIKFVSNPPAHSLYNIRLANHRDFKNIFNCFKKAHIAGLNNEMLKSLNLTSFFKNISDYYNYMFYNHELVAFICEKGGEFCGHSTYSLGKGEFFTGKNEAAHIDTFILEEFKGCGLEQLLMEFGEQYCFAQGYRQLVGTVESNNEDSINQISEKITKLNWRKRSLVYGAVYLQEIKNHETI